MFKKLLALIVAFGLLFPTTPVRAEGTGPVQRLGTGIPTSIAAAPDGKMLAVGSSIGVWFLDAATLTPTGFWDTGVGVDSVAYNTDGQYLRVNEIVYEVASGSVVEVREVAWIDHRCSVDGRLCVAQLVRDGFVYSTKVVDTNTLIVTKMLEVGVDDMAWSPDGKVLYTVGYEWRNRRNSDEIVKAWDTETWREMQRAENLFTTAPLEGVWSSSERIAIVEPLVTVWGSRRLYLYETTTQRLIGDFLPHRVVAIATELNNNGQFLATSGGDVLQCREVQVSYYYGGCEVTVSSTRIWAVPSLQMLGELPSTLYDVVFSPDSHIIAGHTQTTLEIWNWESHQLLWSIEANIGSRCSLQGYRNYYGYYWCLRRESGLAIDSSGEYLADYNVTTGKTLRLYRLTTGDLVATLTGHTAPITGVAFSPDGTKVATSSQDGTILIWDVP